MSKTTRAHRTCRARRPRRGRRAIAIRLTRSIEPTPNSMADRRASKCGASTRVVASGGVGNRASKPPTPLPTKDTKRTLSRHSCIRSPTSSLASEANESCHGVEEVHRHPGNGAISTSAPPAPHSRSARRERSRMEEARKANISAAQAARARVATTIAPRVTRLLALAQWKLEGTTSAATDAVKAPAVARLASSPEGRVPSPSPSGTTPSRNAMRAFPTASPVKSLMRRLRGPTPAATARTTASALTASRVGPTVSPRITRASMTTQPASAMPSHPGNPQRRFVESRTSERQPAAWRETALGSRLLLASVLDVARNAPVIDSSQTNRRSPRPSRCGQDKPGVETL